MKRSRASRLVLAALALAVGAAATDFVLKACADATETVFVNTAHPDADAIAPFAQGDLGLLQPGFARSYLVVAYRHMAGLGLADGAQKDALVLWHTRAGIGPSGDPAQPGRAVDWDASSRQWQTARKQVMGDARAEAWGNDFDAPPITAGAYGKAAGQLEALLKSPGPQDPWVNAWVEGPDLVFSRMKDRALPTDAPTEAPAWFKQARAYQHAAALYYLRRFDEAGKAFTAIAADPRGADRGLCLYLAASCQAKALDLGQDARRALAACNAAMKDPLAKDYEADVMRLKDHLGFVQDPEAYLRDLGSRLSGPLGKEDFHALLDNYTYAWDRIEDPGDPKASARHLPDDPLTAWIQAFQSGIGAEEDYLAKPSLPWLVAALVHAKAGGETTARLMADAAKVPSSSPAYYTLQYHLARLEVEGGAHAAAAKRITSFDGKAVSISFANAMRLLKRRTDTDFAAFVKDLPLQVAGLDIDGSPEPPTPKQAAAPELRDEDKLLLQTSVPLDVLEAAAKDPSAPEAAGLARIAFEKALWLDQVDAVQALASTLPGEKELGEMMVQAKDKDERRFVLGLREGRIRNQRGYPQLLGGADDAQALDQLLTPAQRERARAEQASIQALGDPVRFHCSNVLAYAKAHPEDPRVPEALHQAVRLTRNYSSGASSNGPDPVSRLSAQCFQLLHQTYSKSEWTAKTKYHY